MKAEDPNRNGKALLWTLGVLGGLAVIGGMLPGPDFQPKPEPAKPVERGDPILAKFAAFACKDKEFMQDAFDAWSTEDRWAYELSAIAVVASVESGSADCVHFDKGDQAVLMEVPSRLSDLIVIRKQGYLGRYYAFKLLFGRTRRSNSGT